MKQTLKSIVLLALRAYKWALSPLLPPACRYVPSCSEYAMEAVDRYGVARGLGMAAWRLLRCHPFVKGGFDPVTRVGRTRPARPTGFSKHPLTGAQGFAPERKP